MLVISSQQTHSNEYFQRIPHLDSLLGDISEPDEDMSDTSSLGSEASLELDKVPRHQLLDNSAAKHKTELVHRYGAFLNI